MKKTYTLKNKDCLDIKTYSIVNLSNKHKFLDNDKKHSYTDCLNNRIINLNLNNNVSNRNTENSKKLSLYINTFLSNKVPKLSINDYIERIVSCLEIDNSTIVVTIIYLARIKTYFTLNQQNIHKACAACFLLALKYNNDELASTYVYSKAVGIKIIDVIALENAALNILNFNLYVDYNDFNMYKSQSIINLLNT